MPIVYDVRPLQTSSRLRGIGTVTRRLLETISTLDKTEEVLLLRWPGEVPTLDLAAGFRWRWLEVPRPFPRKVGWLVDRWGLGARLKGVADVAHFTSPFDLDMGWPFRSLARPRSVVVLYDLIPLLHAREMLTGKHRILAPLFRWMAWHLRRATRLVSISESTARLAVEALGLDARMVRVAPIGVEPAFRRLGPDACAPLRARLGLSEPYLLYVGGANPNKNLRRLLEAFAHLQEIPSLVMLTRGLPAPVDPRVRVLDALDDADMPALYNGARLVVNPSRFEGFGLPVLEAMACARPVVCSDIAPFREVAADAVGYFQPEDVADMVGALRRAWADDAWRMRAAEAGVARAAPFTWERCARIVLDVWREL